MRGLLNYDNPFMTTLETIINMIILSCMWLLFCIPIFTIGASTTALYYSVQKWLKNERGHAWTCFWDGFRTNFKKSTLGWLIFLAIEFVILTDLSIMQAFQQTGSAHPVMRVALTILAIIVAVYGFWFLASQARFENSLKQQMKNAGLLMIVHFPVSLYMVVIFALAALIVYIGFYFIIAVPVLAVWLISLATEKVFRKYMSDEDKKLEDELNMNGFGDKKRIL